MIDERVQLNCRFLLGAIQLLSPPAAPNEQQLQFFLLPMVQLQRQSIIIIVPTEMAINLLLVLWTVWRWTQTQTRTVWGHSLGARKGGGEMVEDWELDFSWANTQWPISELIFTSRACKLAACQTGSNP